LQGRSTAEFSRLGDRELAHHISGMAVVTAAGELVGIVTEGDLLHNEPPVSHGQRGIGLLMPNRATA
jgi:CBS domain-containing protein